MRGRVAPWAAVTMLAMLLGAMSLAKYSALHSNVLDLGVFQFNFFAVTGYGEWQRAVSGHAQPLMSLWAGVYSALPAALAPQVLLAAQAVMLVLPVALLWRHFGGPMAAAYALYAPLWINAHFDFHLDHLAVPLLLVFYLAVKAGKPYTAMIPALLLMGVKEPFALLAIACGVFLIWVGLRRSAGMAAGGQLTLTATQCRAFTASGLMLVVGGAVYFYVAAHYMIPYFTSGVHGWLDSGAFSWLGHSIGEMVPALLTRPLEILREILSTPGKLTYLFVVFGLLAFIPFLAPGYLIPALPLLAIAMLSSVPNYYDYNTHYTAGLIIPVMFAFIHGLPKAHAWWMKCAKGVWRKAITPYADTRPHPNPLPPGEGIYLSGGSVLGSVWEANLSKAFYALLALWILVGHVLISPSPISRLFWSDKVWSYSWQAYVPTEREAMMKEAMLKYIPADPEVSVTTQNTVNWHHLAHRKVYAPFPRGIEEPIQVMDWSSRTWDGFWRFVRTGEMPPAVTHDRYADYVVLDLKRPWFIVDKGCEWIYGECRDKEKAQEFLDLVARTKMQYETLFERDGFMILRRR